MTRANRLLFSLLLFLIALPAGAQRGAEVVSATTGASAQPGTAYALVVGISKYAYLRPLQYADEDALLFKSFLTAKAGGGVPDDPAHLKCLINEEAKAGTIWTSGLRWMESRPYGPGDRLYIYLAGHGDAIDAEEYYFLGADCNPGADKNNYNAGGTVQMYNLKNRIAKIAAQKVQVFLIMDACRTNELPGGSEGQMAFAQGIADQSKGEIMLYAAGPNQTAMEGRAVGGGHGLFTWYLVDALSGEADLQGDKNGKTTLLELSNYLNRVIPTKATEMFGTVQIPTVCCNTAFAMNVVGYDSAYYAQWAAVRNTYQTLGGSSPALASAKRTAGAGSAAADTVLIALYNRFGEALRRGKLSGEGSAEGLYADMARTGPRAPLTEDARYALAGAYIDDAQAKINVYLSGTEGELATARTSYVSSGHSGDASPSAEAAHRYASIAQMSFGEAGTTLDKALHLVADDTALVRQFRPKLAFLHARALIDSNLRDGSLRDAERIRLAVAHLDDAIRAEPGAAYLYHCKAMLLINRGDYDGALAAEVKAAALAPAWAKVAWGTGLAHKYKKEYPQSREAYTRAIRLDSTYCIAYLQLGSVYAAEGLTADAERIYLKAASLPAADAAAMVWVGSYYHSKGAYSEAIRFYNRALEEDSSNVDAYVNLGRLALYRRDFTELARIYTLATQWHGYDPSLYIDIADAYAEAKDFEEARTWLEKAVAKDSTNLTVLNAAGSAFYKQRDYAAARAYYERCLQLDPRYIYAMHNLGLIAQAERNYAAAIRQYTRALAIEPNNTKALEGLADAYAAAGDRKRAEEFILKRIAADTGNVWALVSAASFYHADAKRAADAAHMTSRAAAAAERSSLGYYNVALLYDNNAEAEEAARFYRLALASDSTAVDMAADYADLLSRYAQPERAGQIFSRLAAGDRPLTARFHYLHALHLERGGQDSLGRLAALHACLGEDSRYASCYGELGEVYAVSNPDSAIYYFNAAALYDPASLTTHLYLGYLWSTREDYAKAGVAYNHALALDSTSGATHRGLAYLHLLKADTAAALRAYATAIRHDSTDVDAWLTSGQIRVKTGDYTSAITAFTHAAAIAPNAVAPLTGLAYAHLKRGSPAEALPYFRKAIEADSSAYSAYYDLACFYSLTGAHDQAFALLEESLKKGLASRTHLDADPDIDPIRKDPRYEALLSKYLK